MDDTQKLQNELTKQLESLRNNNVDISEQTQTQNNGAIDLGDLNDTPDVRIPEPVQARDFSGEIASLDQSIAGLLSTDTGADRQNNDLIQGILGTSQQLGQRGAFTGEVGEQLGIADKESALTAAENRVSDISSQIQQAPLVIQEEASGQGQTRFTTDVRGADAQRALAIQGIGAVNEFNKSAKVLELARAQQDRIVDQKFAPLEAQLETMKLAYSMNKDTLNRIDSKKTQQAQIMLNERERILGEMKDIEKTKQQFAINAQANGADRATITAIQNAGSIEEAIAVGGQSTLDPQTVLAQRQFEESVLSNQFQRNIQTAQFNETLKQNAFNRGITSSNLALSRETLRQQKVANQLAAEKAQRIEMGEYQKAIQLAEIENFKETEDIKDIDMVLKSPYFDVTFGAAEERLKAAIPGGEQKVPGGLGLVFGEPGKEIGNIKAIVDGLTGQQVLDEMSKLKGSPSDKDADIVFQAVGILTSSTSSASTKRDALIRMGEAKQRIQKQRIISATPPEYVFNISQQLNN